MIRVIFKKPADKEVVDSSIKELGLRLDVYDQILSKQKYIAGDVSRFFTITVNLDRSETTLFSFLVLGNHTR